eukprot:SAG22_NODE_6916_length_795_cov_1.109195_1_plen_220_part_01
MARRLARISHAINMSTAAAAAATGPKAAFGSWKTPITSELITAGSLRLGSPVVVNGTVWWAEGRPQEGGRQVLVRADLRESGEAVDVTPPGFNVRTRVHEYGGGAFLVAPSGDAVFFSNFADQRLYQQAVGGAPTPLTPESGTDLRFADYVLDAARNRLIAVVEDHAGSGGDATKVTNFLAAIPLGGGGGSEPAVPAALASGSDFYAAPRLSPDGAMLAW